LKKKEKKTSIFSLKIVIKITNRY